MNEHLNKAIPQRQIVVVGGAIGDIVLTLNQLPLSGQDIVAVPEGQQIGGCAFNVARVLKKLGLNVINGIPVGHGTWGMAIEKEMAHLGLPILLRHNSQDNGWCLALVEPDGERTFITVEGCETDWQNLPLSSLPISPDSIVYVSGYELVGDASKPLQAWLANLPDSVLRFVDPGPRLPEFDSTFMQTILSQNTLLTLNRDEIAILCGEFSGDPIEQVQQFLLQNPVTIIARLDSKGAWLCRAKQVPIYISAYRVAVVDTIGAGDSHCGGVIAGIAQNLPLDEAILLGNQVAAIVVSRRGAANPPTQDELAQFASCKGA